MTMRKRVGSVMFTAAAAAAVLGMSVGPALASTTLTVKVSHGGKYTAKAGTTILTNGSGATAVSVTCASSKAAGKMSNGTHKGKTAVTVGTATSLSFSTCGGAAGTVTTTVESTPYKVQTDSKTNSKGQTDAIITGIKTMVSMTGCSFTVTGSAEGYYSNKTHKLTMTTKLPVKPLVKKAQLTVSGVAAGTCFNGIIANGNHPTFTASYKLNRPVKISSK